MSSLIPGFEYDIFISYRQKTIQTTETIYHKMPNKYILKGYLQKPEALTTSIRSF